MNVPRVMKASSTRRRFMGRSTAVRAALAHERTMHGLLVPLQAARGSSRARTTPWLALHGIDWSHERDGEGCDAPPLTLDQLSSRLTEALSCLRASDGQSFRRLPGSRSLVGNANSALF